MIYHLPYLSHKSAVIALDTVASIARDLATDTIKPDRVDWSVVGDMAEKALAGIVAAPAFPTEEKST